RRLIVKDRGGSSNYLRSIWIENPSDRCFPRYNTIIAIKRCTMKLLRIRTKVGSIAGTNRTVADSSTYIILIQLVDFARWDRQTQEHAVKLESICVFPMVSRWRNKRVHDRGLIIINQLIIHAVPYP